MTPNFRRITTAIRPRVHTYPPETPDRRPVLEECRQAGELLGSQAARDPERRVMSEGNRPSVAGMYHPLTDHPFADAERFGYSTLRSDFLLDVPSLGESGFFPGGGWAVQAS